jgi:hypothetical protein
MSAAVHSAHEDTSRDIDSLLALVDELSHALRGAWAILQQVQVHFLAL